MARKGRDPREELAAYRKEIGRQYMDGLISDKEYEEKLYAKEAELGLGDSPQAPKTIQSQEGPECPSCGALHGQQDTECLICGAALTPVLAQISQPSTASPAQEAAVPNTWREDWIDKPFREMPPGELMKQPPDVLKGVSKDDSRRMAEAFNVKTLGDFASVKYLAWAQELAAMRDSPGSYRKDDFRDKLIKEYEAKELADVLKSPVYTLQGVSEGDAKKIAKAFNVKTVEELGNLKFIAWAEGIGFLAEQDRMDMLSQTNVIPENWRELWLDKQFRNLPPEELLKLPPDALKGVSADDSARMKAAFNVKTLGDFATTKYLIWAQELVALKDDPGSFRNGDFRHKLVKKYEEKRLDEILASPTHALQGVSEGDAQKLAKSFGTKTVEDLGTLKYAVWANMIYGMAPPKIFRVGDKVLTPSGREGRVAYVTEPNVKGIQEVEVAVGQ